MQWPLSLSRLFFRGVPSPCEQPDPWDGLTTAVFSLGLAAMGERCPERIVPIG